MAYEDLKQSISATRASLVDKMAGAKTPKVVLGLDGFVDEIIHVVETRADADNYTRMSTIGDMAGRIAKAQGLSTNIELIPKQLKLGGNGPIMANALVSMGADLSYIGCLGYPEVHSVFKDLATKANVFSVSDPGHTDAIEFNDGKLMLGKIEVLKEVNWESLVEKVGVEKLTALLAEADLAGWENWTMLVYMTDIWEHMLTDILPNIPTRSPKPYIFFDLADPEKRSKEDIAKGLETIKKFNQYYNVILGLNLKESGEVAEVLGAVDHTIDPTSLGIEKLTRAVADKMGVYCLVVHAVAEAACVVDGKYYHTPGPYVSRPRLTTGAGDNFNAGFVCAVLLGLDPLACLVLGTASSGFYCRAMRSATLADFPKFLEVWEANAGEDFLDFE